MVSSSWFQQKGDPSTVTSTALTGTAIASSTSSSSTTAQQQHNYSPTRTMLNSNSSPSSSLSFTPMPLHTAKKNRAQHPISSSSSSTTSQSSSVSRSRSSLQAVIGQCLYPRPSPPIAGFSPLLLEYGEHALMDWAVVLSTSPSTSKPDKEFERMRMTHHASASANANANANANAMTLDMDDGDHHHEEEDPTRRARTAQHQYHHPRYNDNHNNVRSPNNKSSSSIQDHSIHIVDNSHGRHHYSHGTASSTTGSSGSNGYDAHWVQSPEVAQRYNNGSHHQSTASSKMASSSNIMSSSPHQSSVSRTTSSRYSHHQTIVKSSEATTTTSKDVIPTSYLSRMEGRLYLCSRSVVFEPTDPSQPILRCPLARMAQLPHCHPSNHDHDLLDHPHPHHRASLSSSSTSTSVSSSQLFDFETIGGKSAWTCLRYWVIKQNCTGPFDPVVVPTTFTVTFLHSSPTQLVSICEQLHPPLNPNPNTQNNNNNNNNLHQVSSHPKTATVSSTTTSTNTRNHHVLQPMDRPMDVEYLVDLREQVLCQFPASLISPLIEQAGVICITSDRIYFSPSPFQIGFGGNGGNGGVSGGLPPDGMSHGGGDYDSWGGFTRSGTFTSAGVTMTSTSNARVQKWSKHQLIAYARRFHGLRDTSVELYFGSHPHDHPPPNDMTTTTAAGAAAVGGAALTSTTKTKTTTRMGAPIRRSWVNKRTTTAVPTSTNNSSSSSSSSSTHTGHRHSILIALRRRHDREVVIRNLENGSTKCSHTTHPMVTKKSLVCFTSREFVAAAFQEWQQETLSNMDYLLALNAAAGRTYHDLSRYPVFPWVIQDYESTTLDLTLPSTYRDLTKPIGALSPKRLEYFKARMASMQDGGDDPHPFLYGTHYSAPGYVLYYLVRSMPEHMLCLQNGKFDTADRMFHSIHHCFQCVMSNHADVKELLPEFYCAPTHNNNNNSSYKSSSSVVNGEGGAASITNTSAATNFDFLLNARRLQLGTTQTGERVDDVILPPWAKSARDFLRKNRQALESPICSQSLSSWIDLIFGCTSRGDEARKADNLFHACAYLTPMDLDSKSEEERSQMELHATEFGIVPDQLFTGPHPKRGDHPSQDTNFIADIGRAPSPDDNSSHTSSGAGGGTSGGAWELLDHPQPIASEDSSLTPALVPLLESRQGASAPKERSADHTEVYELESMNLVTTDPGKKMVMPGVGKDLTRAMSQQRRDLGGDITTLTTSLDQPSANHSKATIQQPSSPQRIEDNPLSTWDMKIIERKHVHADAISGCVLFIVENKLQPSILATTSLDGGMKIHKIGVLGSTDEEEVERKGFPSAISRFAYSSIISRGGGAHIPSTLYGNGSNDKLTEYRSHTSRDPLACLAIASIDGEQGLVAFAGGHDDIILAYGIHSACAVASIYSHRDAVTGLDLISRTLLSQASSSTNVSSSPLWLEQSTHLMISGSWDATVKVWSTTVSSGEAVTIHREPLAELFDADSSIVCVSAALVDDEGIAVAAGCADGSFCVWNIHHDGVQVVLHKEPAKRGSGTCSVVKWVDKANATESHISLFTAFSTGVVASYALLEGGLHRRAAVSIGAAILSLAHTDGHLWVGSADGALRLIPIRDDGSFDKPTLWNAVNHKASPGISSIGVTGIPPPLTRSNKLSRHSGLSSSSTSSPCFLCCTGGQDGSVALFELHNR